MTNPSDTIVIEGERERQGDFIFTADVVGEYSFCFSNDMSSFSEKLVDFDIMVESEPRPIAPAKPTALTEQTSSLEESIYKLSGSLSSIQRTQKYFRTRENRNVRPPLALSRLLSRPRSNLFCSPSLRAGLDGQVDRVADLLLLFGRECPHGRNERFPGVGCVCVSIVLPLSTFAPPLSSIPSLIPLLFLPP